MNLKLFYTFFKLGLFTFGGGYAMIPHLTETVINKEHWLTEDEMMEIIAIAESTPGPIAVNMATYIGYKQNKILGSIFSTLGVILPSFIIIFIISLFLDNFMDNKYVKYAFNGITCCVAFLILKAGVNMIHNIANRFSIILMTLTILVMYIINIFTLNISSIYLILLGGILGIIYYSIVNKKGDVNQ